MTNRKFKDYHKNKLMSELISKNFELQCEIIVALRQMYSNVFYKKVCQDWFEDLALTTQLGNEWEQDGTLDYKLDKKCEQYGVDRELVKAFVKSRTESEKSLIFRESHAVNCLTANATMALLQTAEDFHIGHKRMEQLQRYLLANKPTNAVEIVKEAGYIDCHEAPVTELDWRKWREKKEKFSLAEIKEASEGLEAFRAWSKANVR